MQFDLEVENSSVTSTEPISQLLWICLLVLFDGDKNYYLITITEIGYTVYLVMWYVWRQIKKVAAQIQQLTNTIDLCIRKISIIWFADTYIYKSHDSIKVNTNKIWKFDFYDWTDSLYKNEMLTFCE